MSSLPSTVPTPPPTLVVGSKGSGSGTASSGDDRTGDKSMQPPPVPAKTAAATGTASTSLIDRLRLRWRRASLEMDGAASHSRSVYVNAAPPLADYDEYGRLAVHYETNEIHTNKYSVFTFIPKNLYEQFRRLANFYFLALVVVQCVPYFNVASPLFAAAPILFIVMITGLKDMYEDLKRYQADRSINNSETLVLQNHLNLNINHLRLTPLQHITSTLRAFFHGLFRGGRAVVRQSVSSLTGAARDGRCGSHQAGGRSGSNVAIGLEHLTMLKIRKPAADSPLTMSMVEDPAKSMEETAVSDKVIPAATRLAMARKVQGEMEWTRCAWKGIHVGDIVMLQNNQSVPADIVVLSTSEIDGLCYIETKNLDGETNLKIREAISETAYIQSSKDLANFHCRLDIEPPNNNLYTFNGAIILPPKPSAAKGAVEEGSTFRKVPVTINELLLRGCLIRNTKWIIGVVVCTGKDTKLIRNAGPTPSKRSMIERQMNPQVAANFVLTIVLCSLIAILDVVNDERNEKYNAIFSFNTFVDSSEQLTNLALGITTFVYALIMLQNIVPISLYVTTEFVKLFQAYFISKDLEMYYEPIDVNCVPKTWNIADDLGQIEYIFSDKTGTLTRNVMEFRKCTIGGHAYGGYQTGGDLAYPITTGGTTAEEEMAHGLKAVYDNPYRGKLTFADPAFVADIANTGSEQHQIIKEFFTLLAACHTVLADYPDESDDFNIVYKAQSPDEAALVATAKDLGFTFIDRVSDRMTLDILGGVVELKVLNIIEFNSTRKRMSVFVQTAEGQIILYTKGADTVVYERLADGQETMKQLTLDHLESFAEDGLRTLCLAYKLIPKDVYQRWSEEYNEASAALVDREAKMDAVAERIERGFTLIGATAIEDRLQDGVPECIAKLAKGGIKIWVLTGDKMETAINIGFSCNLLTREMTLVIIKGTDMASTRKQIDDALETFFGDKNGKGKGPAPMQSDGRPASTVFALIIDGQSLKYALDKSLKDKLVELGSQCKSVICCRVSPLQKAQVVSLIKISKKAMTLAIGDGANDVSMIQEANIGVGIQGQEGMQAAMASDYSVGQFKYLNRLLLVHGHWSYLRTSEMTLLMFYKNMIWTLILFWFQIYCGFTAQLYYSYTFVLVYNLMSTALPPIVLGFMDQDISARFSLAFPSVYKMGIRRELYGLKRFFIYMVDGVYQSLVCFYISYFAIGETPISADGYNNSAMLMGAMAATIAVVNANTFMGMSMLHWTWLAHFSVWGSSLFFILVLVLAYPLIFTSDELFGVAPQLYATGVMWLCVPLSVVICLLPRYLINFINRYFRPRDVDLLREVQKYRSAELDVISKDVDPEDLPLFLPPKRRQSSVEEIEMDIFKRTRSNAEKLAKRINKNFDTLGRRLRNVASLALMHKGREQTNTGYAFAQEPGVAMHLSKMAPATSETMRRQQSLSPAVKGGPPPCKPPPYWDPSKHSSKRGDPKLTMSEGTSSRM